MSIVFYESRVNRSSRHEINMFYRMYLIERIAGLFSYWLMKVNKYIFIYIIKSFNQGHKTWMYTYQILKFYHTFQTCKNSITRIRTFFSFNRQSGGSCLYNASAQYVLTLKCITYLNKIYLNKTCRLGREINLRTIIN